MKHLASLSLLALVAACGGSDDADLAERHGLRMQATAYENRMPGVVMPGEPPSCQSLIVGFSIRAGASGFPPGLVARKVVLSKPGVPPWEASVSLSETGLASRWVSEADWLSLVGSVDGNPPPGRHAESVFVGVARGCPTASFREGDELTAGVVVTAGGEQAVIQTRVTLSAAY